MTHYGRWEVTGYIPSHKQHSLSEEFTPEQITALTGAKSKPSADGKCKHQWEFYAKVYLNGSDGEPVAVVFPCCIWDFKGSRWSAFGPREVFVEMGLLPPPATEETG